MALQSQKVQRETGMSEGGFAGYWKGFNCPHKLEEVSAQTKAVEPSPPASSAE